MQKSDDGMDIGSRIEFTSDNGFRLNPFHIINGVVMRFLNHRALHRLIPRFTKIPNSQNAVITPGHETVCILLIERHTANGRNGLDPVIWTIRVRTVPNIRFDALLLLFHAVHSLKR